MGSIFSCFRNPSLSADHTWTEYYWPLHTPMKREVLHLNSRNSSIMEGLRVKQCAFWRKFLPQLGERNSFYLNLSRRSGVFVLS